jgi:hypothetical protein
MDAMKNYYSTLQQHSPFRSPDWRWRRAEWLVANGCNFSRRRDDEETGCAVRYLHALARYRGGVPSPDVVRRFPFVVEACQLHGNDSKIRMFVEARILARQTSSEIAELTGVSADVVDTYESLFFDCSDRLDASDWVALNVIDRKLVGPKAIPDTAGTFKAFAYYGGPLVLDAVVPYLVDGKDLFNPSLDLSTLEGRQEQTIRLAVAVEMLPRDSATNNELARIALLMCERDRQLGPCDSAMPLLTRDLDSRVMEALVKAVAERNKERQTTPLPDSLPAIRKSA